MVYWKSLLLLLVPICNGLPTIAHNNNPPPLIHENHGILTPFMNIDDAVNNGVAAIFKSKSLVSQFPDSGKTHAILEQRGLESIPIQLDAKYGQLQQFVASKFHPKPVVDVIQEYEKYGNDGGKHRAIDTALIAGYEALSNVLNAAVELPFAAASQFGKKITTSLNTVGGKLVGLS